MMTAARLTPRVLVLFFLLLALSGCEKCAQPQKPSEEARPGETKPSAARPVEINLKETRLAVIPEDYDKWSNIHFNADGKKVAYAARNKGGKQLIVTGNKAGQPYDMVYTDTLILSRDGRVAYSGQREGQWFFVLDGQEGQSYEDTGGIAFSPDGRLAAYEAKKEGKWFVIVRDGERETFQSAHYDYSSMPPVFSPDSRLVLFTLEALGDKLEQTVFFGDALAGKVRSAESYDSAGNFTFSSDGWRFAYRAKRKDKSSIVLGDFTSGEVKQGPPRYDTILAPRISSDGKRAAYTVKRGKSFLVLSDNNSLSKVKEYGPYDEVRSPVFSPDGSLVAYAVMKDGKWHIVIGEKEGPTYDMVGSPVFSPDGARVAYAAKKGDKWFIFVGEKEGPAYDMVVTPVWSPDGKHLVYRARTGTMENARRFIVVADGEGNVLKEGPVHDEVWQPAWSPDGKKVAYGARQGRELWWRVESVP